MSILNFLWLFCADPLILSTLCGLTDAREGISSGFSSSHDSANVYNMGSEGTVKAIVYYYEWVSWCVFWSIGTQPILDAPSVIPHAASCEYHSFTTTPSCALGGLDGYLIAKKIIPYSLTVVLKIFVYVWFTYLLVIPLVVVIPTPVFMFVCVSVDSQGTVLTPTMDHAMSIQPTSMMGPLTQQLGHLSLGSTGTVSTNQTHTQTQTDTHTMHKTGRCPYS